ncbi:MAG TPA: alpha/beta hydrolase [Actinomycetales bacterium]|nr:alpha/beta hydrolase [Actinomycetales bacterium]
MIRSGAADIAVDDSGSGPAVVLLHAGVADRRVWESTTTALADSFRVLAYDRRGYGATTYETEPHDQVADLWTVLDGLGVASAVLVGNSMGGRVALDAALDAQDRVTGLVVVGAAVSGAPALGDIAPEVAALGEELEALEVAENWDAVNAREARMWLDGPSRPEGTVGGTARALFLEMNGAALRAADPGDEQTREPAWDRLEEIAVPLLSVVGTHDLPHLVERSAEIARRVPQGRYVELPSSAHLPMLDDPARFDELVRAFMDSAS